MREIDIQSLSLNPFHLIPREWMLITAGTKEGGYNTMTASWGHMGGIWGENNGMPTTVIYVRPQRYTKAFLDREPLYTLSFFDKAYREALAYLGSHSGRDGDKVAAVGFTPVFGEGYTTFEQARLTLLCRKLYRAPLREEGFFDKRIVDEHYEARDFHDRVLAFLG